MVTRDGQVKLCDFGVSGELVNSFAGTSIGTTYYLAPERMRCEPYSFVLSRLFPSSGHFLKLSYHRITSDVWSLVLTVLEVALNRFPFPLPGEPPLPNGAAGYFELLSYVQAMENPVRVLDTIEGVKYTKAFKEFVREWCVSLLERRFFFENSCLNKISAGQTVYRKILDGVLLPSNFYLHLGS